MVFRRSLVYVIHAHQFGEFLVPQEPGIAIDFRGEDQAAVERQQDQIVFPEIEEDERKGGYMRCWGCMCRPGIGGQRGREFTSPQANAKVLRSTNAYPRPRRSLLPLRPNPGRPERSVPAQAPSFPRSSSASLR